MNNPPAKEFGLTVGKLSIEPDGICRGSTMCNSIISCPDSFVPIMDKTYYSELDVMSVEERCAKKGNAVFNGNNGIYRKVNVLKLTNKRIFQDTSKAEGVRMIPSCGDLYTHHDFFSGFVFRGDNRAPECIFHEGFMTAPLVNDCQLMEMVGLKNGGVTGSTGLSTTICASLASTFKGPGYSSYVYLIDARHMAGFTIPRKDSFYARRFPQLAKIFEVNFMHGIPNSSIVGTVWPSYKKYPDTNQVWAFAGVINPDKLKLAINPEYQGGVHGAKSVVEHLNRKHGSVVRDW